MSTTKYTRASFLTNGHIKVTGYFNFFQMDTTERRAIEMISEALDLLDHHRKELETANAVPQEPTIATPEAKE